MQRKAVNPVSGVDASSIAPCSSCSVLFEHEPSCSWIDQGMLGSRKAVDFSFSRDKY